MEVNTNISWCLPPRGMSWVTWPAVRISCNLHPANTLLIIFCFLSFYRYSLFRGMSHILSHWHNFWRPAVVYSSMKIYCIQSVTKPVLCWTLTRFHWWRVKTIVHVLVTMDGPWKCCGRWRLQHRVSQMSGHCWQFIQFMWWQGVVRGILDRATVWKQGMNSSHPKINNFLTALYARPPGWPELNTPSYCPEITHYHSRPSLPCFLVYL